MSQRRFLVGARQSAASAPMKNRTKRRHDASSLGQIRRLCSGESGESGACLPTRGPPGCTGIRPRPARGNIPPNANRVQRHSQQGTACAVVSWGALLELTGSGQGLKMKFPFESGHGGSRWPARRARSRGFLFPLLRCLDYGQANYSTVTVVGGAALVTALLPRPSPSSSMFVQPFRCAFRCAETVSQLPQSLACFWRSAWEALDSILSLLCASSLLGRTSNWVFLELDAPRYITALRY